MLEKYLEQKGISANIVYKLFPDLEEDVRNYFIVKESGDDDLKEEVDKLSGEIVENLKLREDAINEYLSNPIVEEETTNQPIEQVATPIMQDEDDAFFSIGQVGTTDNSASVQTPTSEEPVGEVDPFDLPILPQQAEQSPQIMEQPSGELFKDAKGYAVHTSEVTPNIFMKILALNGMDYRYKTNPKAKAKDKYYYWIGYNLYFVTDKNPLEGATKTDIYIFSEDEKLLADAYSIVQSKVISSSSKGVAKKEFELTNLQDMTNGDTEEPVSKIPYKIVDGIMQEIWKIKSMEEISELISLSKKYGCGCGSL